MNGSVVACLLCGTSTSARTWNPSTPYRTVCLQCGKLSRTRRTPHARLTAPREVLHDHYEESFSYIREREKERDRLFLILIALISLLALEIQYPINFRGAVGTLTLLGIELNVDVSVQHELITDE